MKNTGVMCMITVNDANREDGIKHIDIGNYYIDEQGEKCVITTKDIANKYSELIDCKIYTKGVVQSN